MDENLQVRLSSAMAALISTSCPRVARMNMVSRIFACVFAFGLSSALCAEQPDATVDLAGSWKVSASTDGGNRALIWTFSNDGGKLTGESLDEGNAQRRNLDRITVNGKSVKLEVDIEQDGNQGMIVIEAKEDSPGKLAGKWAIVGSNGSEYMSGKVSAVKDINFAGEWLTTAVLPDGQSMESKLKLVGKNSALNGSLDSRAGLITLDEVSAKDRQLRFEFEIEVEGNSINCIVKAEPKDPSNLVGKWSVVGSDGSEVASGKWTAVRQSPGLAGVWDVVATVPEGGEYNGTLTLKEANGKYTGESASRAGGSQPLSSISIEGEKITFTVPFEYEGNSGTITVKAKHDQDDSLKGEWILTGQDGSEYARNTWQAARRK
jgi:hypothetical protein